MMYNYIVDLQTPMGQKHGTMTVHIQNHIIDGSLCILGSQNEIHGSLNHNGLCMLEGRLSTLVRSIAFTATGYISKLEIKLTLQGQRNAFILYGTAIPSLKGDTV